MFIALGAEYSTITLDYEKPDGSMVKKSVSDYAVTLVHDGLCRDWENLKGLFPYLEKNVKEASKERD